MRLFEFTSYLSRVITDPNAADAGDLGRAREESSSSPADELKGTW